MSNIGDAPPDIAAHEDTSSIRARTDDVLEVLQARGADDGSGDDCADRIPVQTLPISSHDLANAPSLDRLHAMATWAMLAPFFFASSSTL